MVRTLLVVLLLTVASGLYGQPSVATQSLRLSVLPVSSIAVSGSPTLTVGSAEAGLDPLPVEDRSTRYRLTSNRPALKMSAVMNEPLPIGMRLVMRVASRNGTSVGPVDLSDASAPSTVVTGISRGTEVDQEIVYSLSVESAQVGPASAKRTVIITITE